MKKNLSTTRLLMFCIVLIITFSAVQFSNAVTNVVPAAVTAAVPGSGSDPLVTKSYLDKRIKIVGDKLIAANASITSLKTQISTMKSQIATLSVNHGGTSSSAKYMTVKKGKTIRLQVGGSLVLYSGTGIATGIISDLTDGKALAVNKNIIPRHLIMSGISDTRGVKAKTDIVVLVAGSYKIV